MWMGLSLPAQLFTANCLPSTGLSMANNSPWYTAFYLPNTELTRIDSLLWSSVTCTKVRPNGTFSCFVRLDQMGLDKVGMHPPCTLYPKYYGHTSSPCTRIYFSENFLGLVPVVFVRSGSKEKWEERLRRKCRVCKVHTIVVNSNTFKWNCKANHQTFVQN